MKTVRERQKDISKNKETNRGNERNTKVKEEIITE
jgi:hypothetical protein